MTVALAALSVPEYRRFWITGLISNIGTAMQMIALDWFVLTLTGSGTAVGWTAGLQFAPVLLFGLWGGVVSDRYDRRRILLIAQSLYTVQAAVLAVAALSGNAPLGLLLALAFAQGCVFTVENPARLSFVPELVGRDLIPNAAGLNILSLTAARLIGPAVAGVLIALIGSGWVFAINAGSYLIVIGGLLSIHPAPRAEPLPRTPWAGAGRAGLRYVAGRPRLIAVFAIFGLVSTFGVTFNTTLTLFAGREFHTGSAGLGFMSTALSAGMVAGTLVAARRSRPTLRLVMLGALAFAAAEALASAAPTYGLFLALLVPAGWTFMTLNTAVSGLVQMDVSEAMRGRVMAVYTVIAMGGNPIGSPAIGWVSDHYDMRKGFLFVGFMLLVGGVIWLCGARYLQRDTARAEGEAAAAGDAVAGDAGPVIAH